MQRPEDRPDYRPEYWNTYLKPLWERTADVFVGLHTEDTKRKYLREQLGEHPDVYKARIQTVAFENRLKPAVKAHAGLLSDFAIDEATPPYIEEWSDSVDGLGRSLTSWLLDWDVSALLHNGVLCVVDVPVVQDERAPREPRAIAVSLTDVYAPLVAEVDGKVQIIQVSICRSESIPSGAFGRQSINKYWVYRLQELERPVRRGGNLQRFAATYQEWIDEISPQGEKTGDIVQNSDVQLLRDSQGNILESLPIVWFSPYGDTVLFNGIDNHHTRGGTPEYLPLIDLNLEYFNKCSELNTAEARANFAILVEEYPLDIPEDKPQSMLMSGRILRMGGGAKANILEPSCTAIASTREGQRDRLNRMDAIAQSFLTGGEHERTATEALIESSQSRLSLRGIARRKESAVAQIFYWVLRFGDPTFNPEESPGGITISDAAISVPTNAQVLTFWHDAYLSGSISREAFQIKLRELGEWTDEMDEQQTAIAPTIPTEAQEDQPLGLAAS